MVIQMYHFNFFKKGFDDSGDWTEVKTVYGRATIKEAKLKQTFFFFFELHTYVYRQVAFLYCSIIRLLDTLLLLVDYVLA